MRIAVILLLPGIALAAPPPGNDPSSPEARWFRGANTPDCINCCDQADGRLVRARPDPSSPEGWDVWFNGDWVPVPAGVRATRCEALKPVDLYPDEPAGRAVIWEYPPGVIRCWVPPGAGG